jgi:SAM-dependent MidA family methyltransferase
MSSHADPSILPPPTEAEREHTARVEARVRERIGQADGWLPFDEFMQIALYEPGLGYYAAGSVKLGAAGDFVTAPEVSPLFGRCVARQCADVLRGGGEVLEFGAGSGRLAAAVLAELAELDALPARYSILEVSPDLRERQRELLAQLPSVLRERVVWLDRLPDAPLRGVVLANEVLDALPCERFVVREDGIREIGVAIGAHGALVEAEAPARAAVAEAVASLRRELREPLPPGYASETCLRVPPWIGGVGGALAQGIALLFDYGLPRSHYYHRDRAAGTLRCHFRHRAHDDPLVNLGVQDITAWVDFTRVAEAAVDAGLAVRGYTTQAAFLLGNGIEAIIGSADPLAQVRLAGEARQLLLPGEMGEAFKAMALGRGWDAPLAGFALRDLRGAL